MEVLRPYLNFVADGVAMIGGSIMLLAVAVSLFRLGRIELAALRHQDPTNERRKLRHHLGFYILLGLEFIVVADILRTILHPGQEEVIILGVVVVIRTVISVTLNWELSRVEAVKDDHP